MSDLKLDGVRFAPLPLFGGELNGAGHSISKLQVQSSAGAVGLFESASSEAVVRNLGLVDVDVLSTAGYAGAVIGSTSGMSYDGMTYSSDGPSIINSYSTGSVESSAPYGSAGGLIGGFAGSILNSYSDVKVTGQDGAGGIAGYVDGLVIENSFSLGQITDNSGFSARLVGCYYYLTINIHSGTYRKARLHNVLGSRWERQDS